MKRAIITGITGQDGAYLSRLLLEKGYEVHGIKRRTSLENTARLTALLGQSFSQINLHAGDLTDSSSLLNLVNKIQPDEIYNLAAQSDVGISFCDPEYTANVDALGPLRILEAIKLLGLTERTKYYQASTSELFGFVQEIPQKETTPFYPRSPYAVAKQYAYWISVNYREAYNIYACNGILFNHESPLRGENFVTKKITTGLAKIKKGLADCLYLGNLNSLRDWGHAKDYVEMQWLMLQQEKPEDYVIATGIQKSVRQFIELSAQYLGISLAWEGAGVNEIGIDTKSNKVIIRVDPRFYRPTEVDTLLGDSFKASEKLNWKPKICFEELVKEMTLYDYNQVIMNNEISRQLIGFK